MPFPTWSYGDPNLLAKDQVRVLIPDTDTTNQLIYDEEINFLLNNRDGNIWYAAADALESIASNQALVVKFTKTLDITVDASKVVEHLLKRAESMRERGAAETADNFDWAEQVLDTFTERQRLINSMLRGL